MQHIIQTFIMTLTISAFTFAGGKIFITEITDPQNSSSAGRYLELYNSDTEDSDFLTRDGGYALQRWTNGNADPTSSSVKYLEGTIPAHGFFIVCNDAGKFESTYGLTCDQDIGTGGAADSNGDDNIALVFIDENGTTIIDMFGVAGEDGTGTGHEFEDGRAERADGVSEANSTWDVNEWNIDNDSGGGDGNQYAPEDFDPGEWIGDHGGGGGSDTCEDDSACNTGSEGDCEFPEAGYDCDGNCVEEDCAGVCGGTAVEDACGVCEGDNSSCSVDVTFSVDMSLEGVDGDIKIRTSTVNGEYNPSDWHVMTDDGNGTYSHALSLLSGVEYGYNFNNSDGSGYEDGDGLGDCAGGNYGNDRFVTPGDSDMELDTVCWESCVACPEDIPGCTDEGALNYDENATSDDGTCIYDWPEADNLFFSEYAEGSSNNKYLEIYNGSDGDVNLSGYSLSSCSNGCNDGTSWDYPDNVQFDANTNVGPGDVYVVCHGSADDFIQAECDQTFTYLSNGDDVFALTQIGSGVILDIIGTIGDDPGSGWEVAGVSNATKDHTLVRDASVNNGNGGNWDESAGDADGSEWVVLDQNTWDYLGSHPHSFAIIGCMDEWACNYNPEATEWGDCEWPEYPYDCEGNCDEWVDCAGECGGVNIDCWELDSDLSGAWNFDGYADCNGSMFDTTIFYCHDTDNSYFDELTCNAECETECYSEELEWVDYVILGDDGSVTFGGNGEEFDTGETWGTYGGQFCIYNPGDDEHEEYASCFAMYSFGDGMMFELGTWLLQYFDDNFYELTGEDCYYQVFSPMSTDCALGDANGDGLVNVLDVVVIVNYILNSSDDFDLSCVDVNGDGILNVLDLVAMVSDILGARSHHADATSAKLIKSSSGLNIHANGYVGGIQMTLQHGSNFSIQLNENAWLSDYSTMDNQTKLVILEPTGNDLFTSHGHFEITEMIIANSQGEINATIATDFSISDAYPNPFNPSTTVELMIPESGHVSVMVYNLTGQLVAELANSYLNADNYQFTWNANMVPSGMYILRTEYAGNSSTQKLMLLK